jgi:hypothetical protein
VDMKSQPRRRVGNSRVSSGWAQSSRQLWSTSLQGYSIVDGWIFEGGSAGGSVSASSTYSTAFPNWQLEGTTLDFDVFRVKYTQKTNARRLPGE